jgi:hypothetical protein
VTAADELSLETMLLAALSGELSRARRRSDHWLVTEYIWSRYILARNAAVRHHAGAAAAGALNRELVA